MNNQIFPKTFRRMKYIHSLPMAQFLTNKRGFPVVWIGTRREDHTKFIFGYDETEELLEVCEEYRRSAPEFNKMKEGKEE